MGRNFTPWLIMVLWTGLMAGPALAEEAGRRVGEVELRYETDQPLLFDPEAMRGVAGFTAGDVLTARKLQDAIKNLYQVGIFESVEASADGPAEATRLQFRLRPYRRLAGVRAEGVTFFKRKALRKASPVVKRSLMTDEVLRQVREKLTELYKRNGFLQAQVQTGIGTGAEAGFLLLRVTEGRRFRQRPVELELVSGQMLPGVAGVLRKHRPVFYSAEALDQLTREIRQLYSRNGYPAVRLESFTVVDEAAGTITPVAVLESGARLELAIEGASVSSKDLAGTLAFYRLGDLSTFAEEISRRDLAAFLSKKQGGAVEVKSERQESPDGQRVQVRFKVTFRRLEQYPVHYEGLAYFSEGDLARLAGLPEAIAGASEAQLRRIVDDVRQTYLRAGFRSAQVTAEVQEPESAARRVLARVEEGERSVLADVTVNPPLRDEQVRDFFEERLEYHLNRVYTRELTETVSADLSQAFSRYGYQVDRLDQQETETEGRVQLELRPRVRGPLRMENLVVIGSGATQPETLDRMVRLKSGDPLDVNALNEAESRLYASGVFEDVMARAPAVYGHDAACNAVFLLREAPRYTFSYGLGYHEYEGPRGLLEFRDTNFLGRTLSMAVQFRASQKKVYGQWAVFGDSMLLGQYPLGLSFYVERYERISFTSRRFSLNAQSSVQTGPQSNWFYRLSFEQITNYDLEENFDPATLEDDEVPITLTTLAAGYLKDTRDDLAEPTRGQQRTIQLSVSPKLFGAGTGFVKLFLQEQFYRRLPGRLTLATSLRAGFIHKISGGEDVPISERFFAGGANTLRGYAQDEAGPFDPVTYSPTGGNAMLLGNVELRFPVAWIIGGAAFYDVGNVFEDTSSISWDAVTHNVGLGLRLVTPVGPVRVDFGFSLKDIPHAKDNQYFIAIGHAF